MIFVVRSSSLDRGGSALHQVRMYIHMLVCCQIIKYLLYIRIHMCIHRYAGRLLDYQVFTVYTCVHSRACILSDYQVFAITVYMHICIHIFAGMLSDYQVFTV